MADDCKWVVVEFLRRSGEFYPDPYIKMDVECIAWRAHDDQDALLARCGEGLRRTGDSMTSTWCRRAAASGITRAEDILRYGKQVYGGRLERID